MKAATNITTATSPTAGTRSTGSDDFPGGAVCLSISPCPMASSMTPPLASDVAAPCSRQSRILAGSRPRRLRKRPNHEGRPKTTSKMPIAKFSPHSTTIATAAQARGSRVGINSARISPGVERGSFSFQAPASVTIARQH